MEGKTSRFFFCFINLKKRFVGDSLDSIRLKQYRTKDGCHQWEYADVRLLPTEGVDRNFWRWRCRSLSPRDWLLHAEFDILQLLEAEPFAVHRHPEVAQVDRVLGARHLLLHPVSRIVGRKFLHFHRAALDLTGYSHQETSSNTDRLLSIGRCIVCIRKTPALVFSRRRNLSIRSSENRRGEKSIRNAHGRQLAEIFKTTGRFIKGGHRIYLRKHLPSNLG